ncbi:MAG: hypothetical protein HGA45_06730 [Chloroflexales bacterium]|nr:hypothetical protein [Chloroflexales bacterium]
MRAIHQRMGGPQRVIGAVALLLLGGLLFLRFPSAACACVPDYMMQNAALTHDLWLLDVQVRQYASEHGGQFPAYAEVVRLRDVATKAPTGSLSATMLASRPLVAAVDPNRRTFTFMPTPEQIGTMGYAVAADGRSYALIGLGSQEFVTSLAWIGLQRAPIVELRVFTPAPGLQ